jgi:hypothetical protein
MSGARRLALTTVLHDPHPAAMPFVAFAEYFPDLARKETRAVMKYEDGALVESLLFVESFCNERSCDCRRVFINVYSDRPHARNPLSTISWGWEPDAFYRKWARFPLSKADLDELRGPGLVRLAKQHEDAEEMLEQFRTLIADEAYASRIVRHYEMFRAKVDGGGDPDEPESDDIEPDANAAPAPNTPVRVEPKPGRNDACPCGSGKKYKKCHGR